MSRQPRMYSDLAEYWPLISAPDNYAPEARYWREALRSALGPGRHVLLELGVGGGNNLSHIVGTHGDVTFDAVGVDISDGMLSHSRRLNPTVEHYVGDMREVRLDRVFDAVIIHDAIAYMTTENDLRATFATARTHLRPSGVLITAPDWFRETFTDPSAAVSTRSDGTTTLTHVEYTWDPDPADTVIECRMQYFIREGRLLRAEEDVHEMGLFPIDTWLQLISEAGFDVEQREYPVHDDAREAWLLCGRAYE